MKFYPQDWRADEKLRLCSLAARGLWIEMLALMHRSERYGQLIIAGHVPTDAQLAVQVGASTNEVAAMLAELESAGVFSRSASGAIYSRRMMRDEKKAKTARNNGRAGGNPSLRKQTGKPASDKGQDKPPDKGGVKPQKPEARKTLSGLAREVFATDWKPAPFGEGTEARRIVDSWAAKELNSQFERFRDHHLAKGSRFDDWQAAWGTWVRNSVGFTRLRSSEPESFVDHYAREIELRKATG